MIVLKQFEYDLKSIRPPFRKVRFSGIQWNSMEFNAELENGSICLAHHETPRTMKAAIET